MLERRKRLVQPAGVPSEEWQAAPYIADAARIAGAASPLEISMEDQKLRTASKPARGMAAMAASGMLRKYLHWTAAMISDPVSSRLPPAEQAGFSGCSRTTTTSGNGSSSSSGGSTGRAPGPAAPAAAHGALEQGPSTVSDPTTSQGRMLPTAEEAELGTADQLSSVTQRSRPLTLGSLAAAVAELGDAEAGPTFYGRAGDTREALMMCMACAIPGAL